MSDNIENAKQSKAEMTVYLQTEGLAVSQGLVDIRDSTQSLTESEAPTKCHQKSLIKGPESLIELQKSIIEKIPSLVPPDCTNYSLGRLHTVNIQIANTTSQLFAPRENLHICTFQVEVVPIPLPKTHSNTQRLICVLYLMESISREK